MAQINIREDGQCRAITIGDVMNHFAQEGLGFQEGDLTLSSFLRPIGAGGWGGAWAAAPGGAGPARRTSASPSSWRAPRARVAPLITRTAPHRPPGPRAPVAVRAARRRRAEAARPEGGGGGAPGGIAAASGF